MLLPQTASPALAFCIFPQREDILQSFCTPQVLPRRHCHRRRHRSQAAATTRPSRLRPPPPS